MLRARFGTTDPAGSDQSNPSRTAALFAGKKPKDFEDDNSGGGTTPFLLIMHKGGGTLTITVAAKTSAQPVIDLPITVHCFEARETEATLAAAAQARQAVEEIQSLVEKGDHAAARSVLTDALSNMQQTLGAKLSAVVNAATWELGFSSYQLGGLEDLEVARALSEQVLEVRSLTLPEDHPDLQTARQNLAVMKKALGDLAGARALEEHVLEVRSRILPGDHPDVQAAKWRLASTIAAQGDLEGARALQEQVLDVFSRTLPPNHRDLQVARQDLAVTIGALGDLSGARTLLEQVLEVLSRSLPSDHPDLQLARGNLAATLKALGDLVGARAIFEQVLEVRSRTLPGDHPDLQIARGNLAVTMKALGDLDGARELEEQVLETRSRTLPRDHSLLQLARSNLAVTLSGQGNLAGGRVLFAQVLEVFSRTLPGDHPNLQLARANLAASLKAQGALPEARALLEQVLVGRSRILPSEHPDLLLTQATVARYRAASGKAAESQELVRTLASTTMESGRSLDSILEKRFIEASVVDTVLSVAAGANAFEADSEGERLGFAMCEGIRGAEASAARLARSLRADAESWALRDALTAASRTLNLLAGSPAEDRARLAEVVRERDGLRRNLLSRLQETGAEGLFPELEAKAIAARLEPDEAAIAYWRYERWQVDLATGQESRQPCYLAWVLRPGDGFERIELGPAAEIENAIEAWREALGAPTRGLTTKAEATSREKGERVRKRLIDPVLRAIGSADRVRIAPAGAVHLVPLDALPSGDGVLGDSLEIVSLNALSELTVADSLPRNAPSVLSMGGISYDGEP
ncbi:MAG: tetratricopeptide repeat protein, partial [Planctomycetota bacterium]